MTTFRRAVVVALVWGLGCSRPALLPDGGTADAGPTHGGRSIDAGPSDGGYAISIAPPAGACTSEGWCWDNPVPVGTSWLGVWVASDAEAWAVGEAGQTYHYLGGQWSLVPSGTTETLTAAYGFAPDDVWAVGEGSDILHWDGVAWAVTSQGGIGFSSIWGMTTGDLWAAGHGTYDVFHFDGGAWSYTLPGVSMAGDNGITAVWGTASDDVWFEDLGGYFYHWDGGCLDYGTFAGGAYGLWGSSPNSYWAGGTHGTVLHWDGGAWGAVANPGSVRALWGTSDENLWGVGGPSDAGSWVGGNDLFYWDGSTWSTEPAPITNSLIAIHGSSATNVWATGVAGGLIHYDGGNWTAVEPHNPVAFPGWLNSVWGSGPANVWAVGNVKSTGAIFHWDGGTWTGSTLDAGELLAVGGTGPDDVWAVGASEALYFDGVQWNERSAGLNAALESVWVASRSDVWAAGSDGVVYRWAFDGGWSASYALSTVPGGVSAVWGSGSSDVYAGSVWTFAHWNGTSWTVSDGGAQPVGAEHLWGSGPNDVYADDVAGGGVKHWDGSSWTLVSALASARPAAIGGSGPDDVWVLDTSGSYLPRAFHWDGAAWTTSYLPADSLTSVYAADSHLAWMVGPNADILRRTY